MKVNYEEAERLYNSGKSFVELAKLYKVTKAAITDGFRKRNILSNRAKIELKIPDEKQLAYYAGFFDGEGHITIAISKNKNPQSYWLQIGVTGTFLDSLDDFKNSFNIGHFSETYGLNTLKRRCRHWRCTSNQAMHVLKCLLPYLRVKKKQAILAIEFQEKLKSKNNTGNEWKQKYKEKLLELKQHISAV